MASQLQTIINRILARDRADVSLAAALGAGIFAGAMMVILTVTYASLIFSGELNTYLMRGISLALASVVIVGITLTLFSTSSYVTTQIDDDTAPVFALMLSLVMASLPASTSEPALLANMLATICVATAVSGLVLFFFGSFKLGSLVQFLPYSVMGGYFAAVGWLLLMGALSMMTDISLDHWRSVAALFQPDVLALWLPAVIVGSILRYLSARVSKGLLLGGGVIASCAVFFSVYAGLGVAPEQLMAKGYLIGPFPEQSHSILNPVKDIAWQDVHWSAMMSNSGSIASISLISLLSIILCISGLSLTTRQDLDTNTELRISGIANIGSALLGGMSAAPSLSVTNLSHEIHPKAYRLVGWTAIGVSVLTFYFGMGLVAYIPKIVLGALLIYIGLGFVIEWIIEGYRKFGAMEYSVIPIILFVSIFAGFLQSIVAGIVAAILLFVVKYSRINVIRYQASGADLRSNLVRDIEQNQVLKQHGEQAHLFTLQGYLFFGTAGSLYREVLDYVQAPENANTRFIILDFSQVIGVDSSATLNFEKLAQRLAEREIFLVTTNLKKAVLEILRRGGLDLDGNAYLIQHADLDKGMEWCENAILREQHSQARQRRGIYERMRDALPNHPNLEVLNNYLEKVELKSGETLTEIGAESDAVYFLESITASAYIIDSRGKERRVSGAGRGAIFGEIGFFLNIPRTAIVRADSDGEIFSLSQHNLKKMEKEEPEMASAITHYLAQIVTERLVNTTQSLRAVL